MTMPTHIPVAGLLVPTPLVPRIIAAIRGMYPTVTADLDDDAAVRAWLKYIVGSTLSTWEGATAQAPVVDAIEEIRADYAQRGEEARQQALAAAELIKENPPATTTPIVV